MKKINEGNKKPVEAFTMLNVLKPKRVRVCVRCGKETRYLRKGIYNEFGNKFTDILTYPLCKKCWKRGFPDEYNKFNKHR